MINKIDGECQKYKRPINSKFQYYIGDLKMGRGRKTGKITGENEFVVIVGRDGHITIPKELRNKLNIDRGSIVRLKIVKVIEE
ncbi:AbrB/MazE/SpoVT family DNA-binding domain-containing protein [Thermococcus sp. MV11]|nr:AbrB/MazE/SpoVT family DNA-binding domain-containing protein [Thermococcus sp. MV11]